MVEIIPAILAEDFQEIQEKIVKVEPYVNWVQIDVSDGNFTPNLTWNDPEQLKNLDTSVFLEVHLMILDPEKYIDNWIDSGVNRVIVHIEAARRGIIDMIKRCHQRSIEFGIALKPEIPISVLESLISKVDLVLFLAVNPGFGGQKFQTIVLEKIKSLRATPMNHAGFMVSNPRLKIEVDGGINPETGKRCLEAGADILVSGSYVFKSKNIKKAIETLENL